MNPNRENFFVSEPATRRGVEAGLTWVYEWGDLTEDGIIVLPVKRQFQGTQFSDVIGAAASKALGLGKRVRAPNGRMLRGYSMRTFPQYSDLGVVLALWVGTKSLDKLHDAQMQSLCVVPWVAAEVIPWARAVGAVDLMGESAAKPKGAALDPVVRRALQSLTDRINLSTGLIHPYDKAAAVSMFRILRDGGHSWTDEEVSGWALAAGWEARHARTLAEVAAGVVAGRRYRTRGVGRSWPDDALSRWRGTSSKE
jgi:hypothetical protein